MSANKSKKPTSKRSTRIRKRNIELMGIYQERLNHEYDKGWEQIRITSYVATGILAVVGLLLRDVTITDSTLLVQAVCGLGFMLALGSFINQIGSQLDARDLRRTLSSFEKGVTPAYYAERTKLINPAGVAILTIGACVALFWLTAFFVVPKIIRSIDPSSEDTSSRPTVTIAVPDSVGTAPEKDHNDTINALSQTTTKR